MPKTKKRSQASKKHQKLKQLKGWRKLVYGARFVPAIAISLLASTLAVQPQSLQSPTRDVLAYATNTSPAGLLSATNTQRSNNGASSLSSNSQLANAAQAKAEDMVARDYWAHVAPDGKQPWAFISAAGYQYVSAGENLAYGFLTSGDTVTGWMNSPSHKQNMLNTVFTEVGFGIANSTNFVGDGLQTIVVAMYGQPKVAAATTSTPSSTAPKATAPKKTAAAVAQATPTPEPVAPVETTEPVPAAEAEPIAVEPIDEVIITTATATPAKIERVKLLTSGTAIWSASAVILAVSLVGVLWAFHRAIHIRRYILAGEHFVAHHIHLDFTVLSIIYLGFVLLSGSGAVR